MADFAALYQDVQNGWPYADPSYILFKSIFKKIMINHHTLSRRINHETWNSNLNVYPTWNSNLSFQIPTSMVINLGECRDTHSAGQCLYSVNSLDIHDMIIMLER